MAYAVGTYAFANPAIDKGKFVDVWKKQAEGSRKDVVGMINSDLPASRRRRDRTHRAMMVVTGTGVGKLTLPMSHT
ncbi:MAG: hypothetical protein ACRDQI_00185 [Pseudonocardiaceae bacterium]